MGALDRLQQLGLASGLSQKEVNPDVTPRRNQGSFSTPTNHRFTNITSPSGGGLGAVDSSGVLSALQEKADIQRKLATDPRLRSLNSRMALASAMRGEDAFQKYAVQPRLAAADADIEIAQKKKMIEATKGLDPQMAYILSKDPSAYKDLLKQTRSVDIEAQKELNKAAAANLKLSDKQKEYASAGLEPGSPEYLQAILGDNSLDLFTKKEMLKSTLQDERELNKLERQAEVNHIFKMAEMAGKFDFDKAIKQFDYDLNYGTGGIGSGGGKAAYELRQGEGKNFLESFRKEMDGARQTAIPSKVIAEQIKNNPEIDFDKWDNFTANLFQNVGLGDADTAAIQTVNSMISGQTLPLAKSLGANPSNRDVVVIREAFGGSTNKFTLALNVARRLADEAMLAEVNNAIASTNYNPEKLLEIRSDFENNYAERLDAGVRAILSSGQLGKVGNEVLETLLKKGNASTGGGSDIDAQATDIFSKYNL